MNLLPKVGQPRFLTKAEVLTLHRASLDEYGGADGFLNEGALDSALAQAMQGFGGQYAHDFPFGMASAYGFHIAMNHAFRDGNKRTAFAAMVVFLRLNGWNFVMPDSDASGLVLEMIELRHDKAWLARRLESLTLPRVSFELRDFFAEVSSARIHEFLAAATVNLKHAEIDQSAQEAASAIPAVRELFSGCRECYERGDAEGGATLGYQATLLVALYRIAEDLGYEW